MSFVHILPKATIAEAVEVMLCGVVQYSTNITRFLQPDKDSQARGSERSAFCIRKTFYAVGSRIFFSHLTQKGNSRPKVQGHRSWACWLATRYSREGEPHSLYQ